MGLEEGGQERNMGTFSVPVSREGNNNNNNNYDVSAYPMLYYNSKLHVVCSYEFNEGELEKKWVISCLFDFNKAKFAWFETMFIGSLFL